MDGVVFMKPKKSNTYCDYPFKQITMKNWNKNELIEYTPCCMMMNQGNNMMNWDNVSNMNPDEAFDSKKFQILRTDLKNGIKNDSCKTCWILEKNDINSPRLYSMENDVETKLKLRQMDISVSNKCNLMCRMCNYGNSHKFQKEISFFKKNNLLNDVKEVTSNYYVDKTFKPNSANSIQLNWLFDNTEKIKVLKISGGEPFYDKNVIELLKKYVSDDTAKNTILQFNTNGTLFSDDLIDLHENFKRVDHYISVDGVDKLYEYIRYPFTFHDFTTSVSKYSNLKNITAMRFACVVSSLNILNMDEWLFHMVSMAKNNNFYFSFQQVRPTTRGTSLNSLPVHLLEEAKQRILNSEYREFFKDRFFDDCESLFQILDESISNNNCNKDKMLKEVSLFDKSRNQNYKNFLDEKLIDWLHA